MSKIVELVSLATIVPPPNHEVSGGFSAVVDGKWRGLPGKPPGPPAPPVPPAPPAPVK